MPDERTPRGEWRSAVKSAGRQGPDRIGFEERFVYPLHHGRYNADPLSLFAGVHERSPLAIAAHCGRWRTRPFFPSTSGCCPCREAELTMRGRASRAATQDVMRTVLAADCACPVSAFVEDGLLVDAGRGADWAPPLPTACQAVGCRHHGAGRRGVLPPGLDCLTPRHHLHRADNRRTGEICGWRGCGALRSGPQSRLRPGRLPPRRRFAGSDHQRGREGGCAEALPAPGIRTRPLL